MTLQLSTAFTVNYHSLIMTGTTVLIAVPARLSETRCRTFDIECQLAKM